MPTSNNTPLNSMVLCARKNPELTNAVVAAFLIAKSVTPLDAMIARYQTGHPLPTNMLQLWKGSSITLFGNLIRLPLALGTRPYIKQVVDKLSPPELPELPKQALAATLAGVTEGTVMGPLATIKTLQNIYGTNLVETWQKLPEGKKFLGLCKGTSASVARSATYWGPFITIAEILNGTLETLGTENNFSTPLRNAIKNISVGAAAGAMASGLSLPFDVLSKHMRTNPEFIGLIKTAANLFKQEGISGFYRGYGLTAARMALVGAILETVRHNVPLCLDKTEAHLNKVGIFAQQPSTIIASTVGVLQKENVESSIMGNIINNPF